MADHNISLFNLTHAPSSWPIINSGATLDVYPNETMYFQVRHNVDPGYTGSPDIAWIICHAGGPTPPGWTSSGISYDDTRQWLNWTTTWFWTVPSNYSGAYTLKWYGANGTPYWNYVDGYRAAYNINVLGALTCDVNSPTGSFTVTIDHQLPTTYSQSTTGTISGLSAGANCTMQDRAMTYAQFLQNPGQISWINSPTPPNLRSYPIVRGIPYVFQVKHAEKPESNALSATVTAPIIPPDTSITMGAGNYNTTDGLWTATFTGCGQIGCVYQVKIAGQSEFGFIHPDLEHPLAAYPTAGGTGSFNNHNAAATPTGTTTIEVWVKQGTGAGGDGIFYNTGVTFTVTRGIPHNESVVNSSGGYYDNISGDGAGHSVILGGLTAGWYYNITDNSDNYISTWTSSSVINKTVTDTSITSLPSGTDVSTSTYKLYRSESSNGSSPTYTGVSYTRSLLNYSRLAFADATQSLDGTDTEFSVIVSNTTAGHSYYIYSGNNIVNTPYPTAGNGGALTITVNETNIPNVNDQVTHILKTSSPVNGNTGEAYATGASYTVTRTGTDTETTTTTEGEYGLEIYAAGSETNKLYDTQSLTGRIMQSGRVPDSGTIPASEDADQEVLGMANTDDFVVVAVPQVSGSGSTGTEAAIDGHNFTLTKATDEFTIRNNGAVANYYHYFVIKNGGA